MRIVVVTVGIRDRLDQWVKGNNGQNLKIAGNVIEF